MKANLAPQDIRKIGVTYVLWFELSNTYTVISDSTFKLFSIFLDADTEAEFILDSRQNHSHSHKELKILSQEFHCFLEEMNRPIPLQKHELSSLEIPTPALSEYYKFGDVQFTVNYSSEKVRQLIHPKLKHATVKENNNGIATFDVFLDNSLLHLYKNQTFIGSYESKNIHFLQGKFSMQLLDVLYKTTELDWLATFHASTITNHEQAIMIIGESGNGKSTLSAVLMAHGFDLLADDFTPMRGSNQNLYRFPAAISIKTGAFSMMESLFKDFDKLESQINTSKQKPVKYLPPSQSFGTSKKEFPCQKIVLVKYVQTGLSELKKISSEKMLQTLIPDTWLSPHIKHAKLFLTWLSNVEFYELTYTNNEFAVQKFRELFQDSF